MVNCNPEPLAAMPWLLACLRVEGFETIMMNCNPETVSTDYDTSSRLYFEPITVEDVLNVIELERPDGIIVQFGGQTPLKIAGDLHRELLAHPIKAASGAWASGVSCVVTRRHQALGPRPGPERRNSKAKTHWPLWGGGGGRGG